MSVDAVAEGFAALLRAGKAEEAGRTYWAEDVVSLEPMPGAMARLEGPEAIRRKHVWWAETFTVHDATTEGPWIHGDQFALRFAIDVTGPDGQRTRMTEIGLYTVRDGKIVEERFFGG